MRSPVKKLLLICALSLLLPGAARATIVCNGDSNTQSGWQSWYPNGRADGWCERVAVELGEATVNRGVGASSISDTGFYWGGNLPLWGGYYVDLEVAGTDPFAAFATDGFFLQQPIYSPFAVPDVFVFAWGTNDITYGYTPRQVITAYKKYRQHVIATGATVYIATTPPQFNADGTLSAKDALIRDLNQRIRGNWPQRYVEFYVGFTADDFTADGIHVTAAGQAKRAQAVLDALAP